MFDYVLKNGRLIDGSGAPSRAADLGIIGDRIAAIGNLNGAESGQTLELGGAVVAPGFIDVHTHTDGWLSKHPDFPVKVLQGYTTEILMADGISYAPLSSTTAKDWFYYLRPLNGLEWTDYEGWTGLGEYLKRFDGNCIQNVAAHIPYANVKTMICGFRSSPPDLLERSKIQDTIRQCMDEGAVGLSSGLEYLGQLDSDTEEISDACKAIREKRGIYVTHIRYPIGMIAALQEAIEIGKRAGVDVHISHLKTSNVDIAREVFELFESKAADEVNLTFDVYPYDSASTMLSYLLPTSAWKNGALRAHEQFTDPTFIAKFERLLESEQLDRAHIAWLPSAKNRHFIGRPLSQYLENSKGPTAQALLQLLREEDLAVLLVFRRGPDDGVNDFVKHRRSILGSDGVYQPGGAVHPRMFGSTARMLGTLVRDAKIFSLEESVKKMTSVPADRFGLEDRGLVAEGKFADITVFDPKAISDCATYDHPARTPVGILHVLVNGTLVVRNGVACCSYKNDCLPGRFLRYRR